jgi:hypothetical protein
MVHSFDAYRCSGAMQASCVNNYKWSSRREFDKYCYCEFLGNVMTCDFLLSHLSKIVNGIILLMIFLGAYLGICSFIYLSFLASLFQFDGFWCNQFLEFKALHLKTQRIQQLKRTGYQLLHAAYSRVNALEFYVESI